MTDQPERSFWRRGPKPAAGATAVRAAGPVANPLATAVAAAVAEELRLTPASAIGVCHERERVTVRGRVTETLVADRLGSPSFHARINDGTGEVTLVWLGRRDIAGIETGRPIQATGRVGASGGALRIFNPQYELFPVDVPVDRIVGTTSA